MPSGVFPLLTPNWLCPSIPHKSPPPAKTVSAPPTCLTPSPSSGSWGNALPSQYFTSRGWSYWLWRGAYILECCPRVGILVSRSSPIQPLYGLTRCMRGVVDGLIPYYTTYVYDTISPLLGDSRTWGRSPPLFLSPLLFSIVPYSGVTVLGNRGCKGTIVTCPGIYGGIPWRQLLSRSPLRSMT